MAEQILFDGKFIEQTNSNDGNQKIPDTRLGFFVDSEDENRMLFTYALRIVLTVNAIRTIILFRL